MCLCRLKDISEQIHICFGDIYNILDETQLCFAQNTFT